MFKSDNELLSILLDQVENHDLQLPDFQRGWVWEDNRIKALLASLTLGYPVGAIMLLESGGNFRFKCKNVEGSGDEEKKPKDMILDGQQRLTSTFLSMRCKNPVNTKNDQNNDIKRYYYLNIEKALSTTTDRVDAIVSVDEKKQKRKNIGRDIVLDLSTEELEFTNKMIPFNIMTKGDELDDWRSNYYKFYNYDKDIIENYEKVKKLCLDNITKYRIPIIKVLKETPKEAVCQVFENVNQGGVPLNVFELLTATFAADNFDLKKHWEETKERFKKYDTLKNFDNTSFLIAITLLNSYKKGGTISCKRKDVLNLKYNEYESYEKELIEGFERMYDLLVDMKIFSNNDIPYNTQLIPLSVVCTILENDLYNDSVKKKIKQWFWCGVFGELYGSANETRYALDVPQLLNWIKNDSYELPKTIQDCNFSSMRLLSLHTKNSAAYKGIMAIIMQNNAKDWISGTEMSITNYIERRSDIHHIFPQRYCEEMNYDKRKWNSIINKTPIFFSTNRYIGGSSPSEYIKRIIKNKGVDNDTLLDFISTHLIDTDSLIKDEFEEFITNRAIKLLDAIEEATGKKITDRDSDDVIKYFGKKLVEDDEVLVE